MQEEQEQGGVVLPLSVLPRMCPCGLRDFGLWEKASWSSGWWESWGSPPQSCYLGTFSHTLKGDPHTHTQDPAFIDLGLTLAHPWILTECPDTWL